MKSKTQMIVEWLKEGKGKNLVEEHKEEWKIYGRERIIEDLMMFLCLTKGYAVGVAIEVEKMIG